MITTTSRPYDPTTLARSGIGEWTSLDRNVRIEIAGGAYTGMFKHNDTYVSVGEFGSAAAADTAASTEWDQHYG